MALQVEEEAGQLNMGVPETVQDCDAVVPEDFPRVSGGLIRDEQEGDAGSCFGSVDELAGGGGVGAVLDFNSNGSAGTGKARRTSTSRPVLCSVVTPSPGISRRTRSVSASN